MNAHAGGSLVAGFEHLIDTLTLPDPDDRHVLAAAFHCGASAIVTYNLADFPAASLAPFDIEAQHPDAFIGTLLDVDEAAVCAATRRHRLSLRKPAKSVAEYLKTLARHHLTDTVAALRLLTDLL
jgi:hypothetical protein